VTQPTPAVLARGLTKMYGALPALESLDLAIQPGEFVLLLGPNGAGKSTLLRLCATLIRPTGGSLHLLGDPLSAASLPGLRRRIGLLSHQSFLYDHLTGMENLLFYGRLFGLQRPAVEARAALETVGLVRRADDLVRTYSRGMLQRLAIARALLHQPDLVLLDEPFTGLDRASSDSLRERLTALRSAGRTCLIATHDFAAVAGLADRLIILADGRLAADRPAGGLQARDIEALFRGAIPAGPPRAAHP